MNWGGVPNCSRTLDRPHMPPGGWGYPSDPLEEMGMIDTTNPNLDAHTTQISPGEDYIASDAGDKSRIQVSI